MLTWLSSALASIISPDNSLVRMDGGEQRAIEYLAKVDDAEAHSDPTLHG
jgi:hypothetical protein